MKKTKGCVELNVIMLILYSDHVITMKFNLEPWTIASENTCDTTSNNMTTNKKDIKCIFNLSTFFLFLM